MYMCARVFELHVRISAKADCMGLCVYASSLLNVYMGLAANV